MIRALLASPWLPLLYWAAAVIAMVCDARHESLNRRLGDHKLQMVLKALATTTVQGHEESSTPESHPAAKAIPIASQPTRFWYPQIFVFQRPDSFAKRDLAEIATNKRSTATDEQNPVSAPITMLSIRADPPEQTMPKTLAIQCRTSAAISNAHGKTVTIRGVVTQEVVSSGGKILIMAGSRVVGSGVLDPENGRFKSEGLWSVFFDDTELRIKAELLDRPSGLPGMVGHETSNEGESFEREAVTRDGRFIFVPRNAPFVLELRGKILFRDLNSNEASN